VRSSGHDSPVLVDGQRLTIADVVHVARQGASAVLCEDARGRMQASYAWVDRAAAGGVLDDDGESLPIYGVNTGYGSLARIRIQPDRINQMSWNLVRSHTAGVGPVLNIEVVRAMMLLRANALAKGASGCRPVLVERLLEMLEKNVIPRVPSRGSCGSSGDLAPLAHLAMVLFATPEESAQAWRGDEVVHGYQAMLSAGLEPLSPGPKEGLAMTNGAQLCTAFGALACFDSDRLARTAEVSAAMSWEALLGVTRALHPAVHALRPYPGAIACAANLRRLMAGSSLVDSVPEKVQDAYSLRCTPQVLGASRDGIRFATQQIEIELNAATDNPLILLEADGPNKAYSAGLFHGEPVGMACDHLKLAVCEIAALAERRIFRLTTGSLSARMPAFLIRNDRPGVGMMVPQTTAASLVSENRAMAYPSTVDSIPTCEDQEDLVAMSTTAARRAADVVSNSQRVVAIELLSAANALWWRQSQGDELTLGEGTQKALETVEMLLGGHGGSSPSEDIETLAEAIRQGFLLEQVEGVVGPLRGVNDV
jgi:histidine ammonia-lyase